MVNLSVTRVSINKYILKYSMSDYHVYIVYSCLNLYFKSNGLCKALPAINIL